MRLTTFRAAAALAFTLATGASHAQLPTVWDIARMIRPAPPVCAQAKDGGYTPGAWIDAMKAHGVMSCYVIDQACRAECFKADGAMSQERSNRAKAELKAADDAKAERKRAAEDAARVEFESRREEREAQAASAAEQSAAMLKLNQAASAEATVKIAAREKAEAQRCTDLKAGRVKPVDTKEVQCAFNPGNGAAVVASPKLRPDGAFYEVGGAVVRSVQDGVVLFELNSLRGPKQYVVTLTGPIKEAALSSWNQGTAVYIVGRYTQNMAFKTAIGGVVELPAFEAVWTLNVSSIVRGAITEGQQGGVK